MTKEVDDVTTLERLSNRRRARGEPPERFHAFVSYTTREDEVRIVKPLVDQFLNAVLRPAIERALGEPPFFYDGYSLYYPSGSRLSNPELESTLRFAIEESEVLIAFVSPEYPASNWCMFECRTMASKELRPWFDLCRIPPIPDLRDQRPRDLRPEWWECVRARLLMWLWRVRKAHPKPGGAMVAVLWKASVSPPTEMREFGELPSFDWTSCLSALDEHARVGGHLSRHGSVSPGWESIAEAFDGECLESMRATANAVVKILQQRRRAYSHRHDA